MPEFLHQVPALVSSSPSDLAVAAAAVAVIWCLGVWGFGVYVAPCIHGSYNSLKAPTPQTDLNPQALNPKP